MKKTFLFSLFLIGTSLFAHNEIAISDEFASYHLKIAVAEIEDQDVFYLIQENVANLKICGASNAAADELIHLIEEGYKIDSFNMAKLVETLVHADASNNATKVIIKAIEHDNHITSDHLTSLINTLAHANASNNATKVLLQAIEHGIAFGPKERRLLAEMSKIVNAKKNVEKIRKALHERAKANPKGKKTPIFVNSNSHYL